MPLLYYWRGDNYRRDLNWGAGYHLNQANPLIHEIDLGDSLWAFTRATNGRYALAMKLVVHAKTRNPPTFRYGRYRLWGDLKHSRYFQVEGQPGIEHVVRALSVRADADVFGRSFQGGAAVRRITADDHSILLAAAADLPVEDRARILPEERLEAALLLGDPGAVEALIQWEKPGIDKERHEYLYQVLKLADQSSVPSRILLSNGRCQICLWHPRDEYGVSLCQGHHLHWLSRGGDDALENLALVCPNHHVAIQACDAPFDYADLAFDLGTRREALLLDRHLATTLEGVY